MDIYIDGQLVQAEIFDLVSFQQFWRGTVQNIFSEKRHISSIEVDGASYYDDFEVVIERSFKQLKSFKIFTLSSEEHLMQLIQSIFEYVPRFTSGIREVADSFYGELHEKDWQQFSLVIEGLNWLYQSIEFSTILIKQVRQVNAYEDPFKTTLQLLEPLLVELETALQNQDYIAVGDLMQYEIAPIFDNIFEVLVN